MVIAISRQERVPFTFKEEAELPFEERTVVWLEPITRAEEENVASLAGGATTQEKFIKELNTLVGKKIVSVDRFYDSEGNLLDISRGSKPRISDNELLMFSIKHRMEMYEWIIAQGSLIEENEKEK